MEQAHRRAKGRAARPLPEVQRAAAGAAPSAAREVLAFHAALAGRAPPDPRELPPLPRPAERRANGAAQELRSFPPAVARAPRAAARRVPPLPRSAARHAARVHAQLATLARA